MREKDFVAVAERFLGTPYLWGGKTNHGLDCSGLVQVALNACGIPCPRDSDMQEQALGTAIDIAQARRGDLVFWKGHVAIVRDGATFHSRQRVSHGGRDRADRGGARAHHGGRQPRHQREADLTSS